MNFVVAAGHKVKIKENETKDKYLNLASELKKSIIIGALGKITKGLIRGLEEMEMGGRTETI